jgi:hypothetical protein
MSLINILKPLLKGNKISQVLNEPCLHETIVQRFR